MIARLRGTPLEILGSVAIIDVQGVGYEVHCSRKCLERLALTEEADLVIYTEVKEDRLALYGFEDLLEKEVFLLLTKVKGVGTRSASEIISCMEKHELLRAIGSSDVTRLQGIKGVGRKTAERIVVELKDKVADFARNQTSGTLQIEIEVGEPSDEAIAALTALGFTRRVAEQAVQKVEQGSGVGSMDSGEIVREALQFV